MELLSNNVNLSAAARILRINPKTVANKLHFLGSTCRKMAQKDRNKFFQIRDIQFDELQTIEHTKLKPLSVAVAVSKKREKYWGFKYLVCQQRGIWRRYPVKSMENARMIA